MLCYFDGCPNWQTTDLRLRQALAATGHIDVEIRYHRVETLDEAERLGFLGSPTVLIDGRDLFVDSGGTVGLACRVYGTPDGLAGSPTVAQLMEVLR
jgi:hypothetical protein